LGISHTSDIETKMEDSRLKGEGDQQKIPKKIAYTVKYIEQMFWERERNYS
jgi:hypothetical protein